MGEAWFLGAERRMYTELQQPDAIMDMDRVDLSMLLFEISSGTKCFGHIDEWDEWFKYMLPDLIERSTDKLWFSTVLFQSLVTAFIAIYWTGIDEHYEGFRHDVLSSLGLTWMDGKFWLFGAGPPCPEFLNVMTDGRGEETLFWNHVHPDENVCAALIFCLKYLDLSEIPSWTDSLTAIVHPFWQGNLMIWFLGALGLSDREPIIPYHLEEMTPKLDWDNLHTLNPHTDDTTRKYPEFNKVECFLATQRLSEMLSRLKSYYTESKIVELAELFSQNKQLALATFNVPEDLLTKLY